MPSLPDVPVAVPSPCSAQRRPDIAIAERIAWPRRTPASAWPSRPITRPSPCRPRMASRSRPGRLVPRCQPRLVDRRQRHRNHLQSSARGKARWMRRRRLRGWWLAIAALCCAFQAVENDRSACAFSPISATLDVAVKDSIRGSEIAPQEFQAAVAFDYTTVAQAQESQPGRPAERAQRAGEPPGRRGGIRSATWAAGPSLSCTTCCTRTSPRRSAASSAPLPLAGEGRGRGRFSRRCPFPIDLSSTAPALNPAHRHPVFPEQDTFSSQEGNHQGFQRTHFRHQLVPVFAACRAQGQNGQQNPPDAQQAAPLPAAVPQAAARAPAGPS